VTYGTIQVSKRQRRSNMTGKTDKDFESSLKKLEQIVRELESGDTSLNESLTQFEEGITLYKQCRQTLEGAEKKIKILSDSLKEIDYKE
jgi:exodeoxyribonuclease VII small subunit